MQPFDLEIGDQHYAVFPEGNDTYIIFKNGAQYLHIQKDGGEQWIKFDNETGTPVFEYEEEVNTIGLHIEQYKEEPEEEDDELDEEAN